MPTKEKKLTKEQKEYMALMTKELHAKPGKKHYPTRHVVSNYKDEVWSMDLVDMREWADDNDEYKWMLNAVDVYTRYAMSEPVKSKTAKDVFEAFQAILERTARQPHKLWVDEGKEFHNNLFNKWCKANDAVMYSSYGQHKSVIVERFNRTLKTKMWHKFTELNTRRWVDMLPDLVSEYNSTRHSTIKMTPAIASLPKNQERLKKINGLPTDVKGRPRKPKFNVNDIVRISRTKGTFEKGYLPNWSRAQYKIVQVTIPWSLDEPIYYKLKNLYKVKNTKDDEVEGIFYDEELQKVNDKLKDVFLVEEVLDERKVKGKKELFVKWLGYDEDANSWIPASNVKRHFD